MPDLENKKEAKASTASTESASTTPNVAVEPQATCFAAAKVPSPKKKLYWAGFSVISSVDGASIGSPGITFQRESQAAFAWGKDSLASLEGKSFSAAALETNLGLDFGDY